MNEFVTTALASVVSTIAAQASLLTTLHISRLLDLNERTEAPLPTIDDSFFGRCVSAIANDGLSASTALKHPESATSISIFWSLTTAEQQHQFVPSGYAVPSDATHSHHAVGPKHRPLGMSAILTIITKQAQVNFIMATSMNLRPRTYRWLKLKVQERGHNIFSLLLTVEQEEYRVTAMGRVDRHNIAGSRAVASLSSLQYIGHRDPRCRTLMDGLAGLSSSCKDRSTAYQR